MLAATAPFMLPVPGESFVQPFKAGYGLRLTGATSGYVGLKPAAAAGSTNFTLPSADAAGCWVSDGSGNLSLETAAQTKTRLGLGATDDPTFGDLTVDSLTILNPAVVINSTTMHVADPLIKLGVGNGSDALDLGFYAQYTSSGAKYTGLFRDATDNKFKLFTALQVEPTTTVNTAGAGYTPATLAIGSLEASGSISMAVGQVLYYGAYPFIQAQPSLHNFYGGGAGNLTGTGEESTAFGHEAGRDLTSGGANSLFGDAAGVELTTGTENSLFGTHAGKKLLGGNYNDVFGCDALFAAVNVINTCVFGAHAMFALVTGNDNTAFGSHAMGIADGCQNNTVIGSGGMANLTSGSNNAGCGYKTLSEIGAGSGNSSLGGYAGFGASGGSNNVLIGYLQSFTPAMTGSGNVLVGACDGDAASYGQVTSGSNNISIGHNVAVASPTASSQLCVGNLIYGTGLSGTGATISTSGAIGFGVKAPAAAVHVLKTTEQLRLGYDATYYVSHTVSSAGSYTITPVSGKVGIGIIPTTTLHTYTATGNVYSQVQRNLRAQGDVGFRINGGSDGVNWYMYQAASSDSLRFALTSDLLILSTNTAIFGHGTTGTNAYAVAIDGGSGTGGGGYFAFRRNSVTVGYAGSDSAITGGSSNSTAFWATAGNGINFYTNDSATARMVIASNGSTTLTAPTTIIPLTLTRTTHSSYGRYISCVQGGVEEAYLSTGLAAGHGGVLWLSLSGTNYTTLRHNAGYPYLETSEATFQFNVGSNRGMVFSSSYGTIACGGPVTFSDQRDAAVLTPIVASSATFRTSIGLEVLALKSTATNDDPELKVYQNRVATTDATVTTLHTIAIADNTTYALTATVECRCTGGAGGNSGKAARFDFISRARRSGGIALLGTVTATYTDQDGTAWAATFDVDGGNNARIRVTGGATDDIVWHVVELKVSPLST